MIKKNAKYDSSHNTIEIDTEYDLNGKIDYNKLGENYTILK